MIGYLPVQIHLLLSIKNVLKFLDIGIFLVGYLDEGLNWGGGGLVFTIH